VFSRLRECRKQVAIEQGVAAYIIFTDEELSNLAQLGELTEKSMLSVNGVGIKKVEKYGKRILELYENAVQNAEHAMNGEEKKEVGNDFF
jgi:ATP-dependent DNA helicase RecQ